VDAARAGDDEQAVVVAVKHRGDLLAAADHRRGALLAERGSSRSVAGGRKLDDPLDAAIANRVPRALALHSAIIAGFSVLASRSSSALVPHVHGLAYGRG
jgi:hypothetical protein